jgi:hypothetical protein
MFSGTSQDGERNVAWTTATIVMANGTTQLEKLAQDYKVSRKIIRHLSKSDGSEWHVLAIASGGSATTVLLLAITISLVIFYKQKGLKLPTILNPTATTETQQEELQIHNGGKLYPTIPNIPILYEKTSDY